MNDGRRWTSVGILSVVPHFFVNSRHTTFDRVRVENGEYAIDRIHDVTAHVTKSTCPKCPPASPIKRQVSGIIVNELCSAQPEIPIQFWRNIKFSCGCRNTLRPYRAVGP